MAEISVDRDKVRRWLEAHPTWTMQDVSVAAKVHKGTVARLLRGDSVSDETVAKIEQAIGLESGELFCIPQEFRKITRALGFALASCQRCRGDLTPDGEGDFTCLQCGHVVYRHVKQSDYAA